MLNVILPNEQCIIFQPRSHLYMIKCNTFITTERKSRVYCFMSVHLSSCYDSRKTFNLTCNLKCTQQTVLIFFMYIPWVKYFQTSSTLPTFRPWPWPSDLRCHCQGHSVLQRRLVVT